MKSITAEEVELLSKLIFDVSGLHLAKDKSYLLETRLNPLLGSHGCATFSQLYAQAKADSSGKLQHEIIEAMTTNETFFFRDNTPFDLLRNKIIPDLVDRRSCTFQANKIPLRIWSAACSSGQEVYSIAMTLIEIFGDLSRYDIHILGTDISNKVIAQASYGQYNQFEMDRGLPPLCRNRYFSQLGADWRIKDEIRGLAQFKAMNLMKPFPDLGGRFDLIFCRNVAIYFSQADKIRLFQKIARVLQPDGYLIVGGSESLAGIAPDFESRNYLKGIFYQLSGHSALAAPRPMAPTPSPAVPKPAPVRVAQKTQAPPVKTFSPASGAPPSVQPDIGKNIPLGKSAPGVRTPDGFAPKVQPPERPGPIGPDLPPDSPAKPKKSLLTSIHARKESGHALRSTSQPPIKSSLLEQLANKKKRSDK